MSISIRLYQSKDRDAVRGICKETAWDSYKKCEKKLETVPIMFMDYFIEQEPQNVLVAVDKEDHPVGYIICATDTRKYIRNNLRIYLPRVLKQYWPPAYLIPAMCLSLSRIKEYPCHMHIDITESCQHMGIGSRLIDALIEHLKKQNFHSLAICSVDRNSPGYGFYRHYGFHEIWTLGKTLVSMAIEF